MKDIVLNGLLASAQCATAVAAYQAGIDAEHFSLCFLMLACTMILACCGFYNLFETFDAIAKCANAKNMTPEQHAIIDQKVDEIIRWHKQHKEENR